MKRLAVIGDPISHSLSPAIQLAAIKAAGLNQEFSYEAVKVAPLDLPSFIRRLRDKEFFGANVTIPHKEAVIPLLDGLTARAKEASSVNTLYLDGANLIGDSTDGAGCIASLKDAGITASGKKVAVLGAGGSGQAVAFAIAKEAPSSIRILNRTPANGQALARNLSKICPADYAPLPSSLKDFDIIINCTPLGMEGAFPGLSPLRAEDLPMSGAVMDLVYRPRMTDLLSFARARGLRAIDGTGMLIRQAALSFFIWTGKEADIHAMEDALREALE